MKVKKDVPLTFGHKKLKFSICWKYFEICTQYIGQYIGINFRDDEDNFKEWINEHGNPFEYILRDDGTIAYEMGLIGVPETFFIVNKMTQKKIQGPLFYEDVEKYL